MSKFAFCLFALSLFSNQAGAEPVFDLRDGDRVVLVGDTLIERAQESGWLETEMAADFADRRFVVRNLGWSADTPAGTSRASFDFADPKKAFDLLTAQIAQVKPTVVVLGYGMASSFGGEAGLAQFKADCNRLIDAIQAGATNQVRFVILSPIRHQELPPPLPDPLAHNAQLSVYTEALRELAAQRGIPFVDLYHWKPPLPVRDLTDNGIHLTAKGYRCLAAEIGRQLGWPAHLAKAGKSLTEALRQTVIRKDQLFFDRWRPQNETYLFGFRKHEQGQNAREIPEFDPLVQAADDNIHHFQDMLLAGKRSVTRAASAPSTSGSPLVPLPLPDFTVAPGFEVNLWAENPLLAKPIQMNFDPQGRLWVASSSVYPQITPGQTADDKIVVLEDTKGSGHADKSTVFADGLFIPQGVEPGDGGCYVGQSTELLHFAGVVGQRKPPQRRVVLSGFGTEDTHHMVHTLAWGPDGMLYFDQSIYIHSHIETPNGVVRLNSGGVFHLRPAPMQLDVFLRGFCNPWGHQFDPFGQSFVTDGAGYQGISWGIPDATYFTYADMRRELQSISPGQYPKFCGLAIVASRQFPDDWQGDFLTADFRAHRVVRFSVSDDGSGYVTKEMPDVLTSTNVTFRPVDLKFGPDGALYVADWSNPIINHGEVDFRDPRRDHEHGRIWRITAKGRPLLPSRNLAKTSTKKLFNLLLSSNVYEVEQSHRVLTERGKKIAKPLEKWTARQTDSYAQLQGLWMHQAIGLRDDALLDKVLQAPDGRIRAAAVRVLSYWPRPITAACYQRALSDPFPRVRLEALRSLKSHPSLKAAELALNTLNQPTDPFLDYALWQTINDLAKPWLAGLQSGAWSIVGRQKQLEFAFNAIEPELAATALHEVLTRQPLNRDGDGPWIELIGRAGSPEDIDNLYQKMVNGGFNPAATARACAALHEVVTSRNIRPKSDLGQIVKLFNSPDQEIRLKAIQLAGDWAGPGESFSRLLAMAEAAETAPPVRDTAFAALRRIGGEKAIAALRPLTANNQPQSIRQSAVLALAALDVNHSGPAAISVLSDVKNDNTALSMWRSLLGTSGAGPVLAAALPRSGFPTTVGKAGMRAVRESGRNEPQLVVALTRAAALQGSETTLTAAEVKKLAEAVLSHGDAARGERIFRSAQQSCMSCHSIGGVGAKVGPDLTSVGASSPIDYLITSVLYPNKDIKDGYQAYLIETTDDEQLSGIPVRENARELVIHTAADQDVTIEKSKIKSKKPGGSLMPSGLADNLTAQEQLDLYRFLSELGKPGPFDASKANVARLWQVTVDPAQSAEEQKLITSSLAGEPWHRAVSLVGGRTLVEDLETAAAIPAKRTTNQTILAGTHFRSVKSGLVHFDLSVPVGTPVWIDGNPINQTKVFSVELPSSVHTIILKLEGKSIPEAIKLHSDDGAFLGN